VFSLSLPRQGLIHDHHHIRQLFVAKLNIGTSFYIGIKELSMKFQSMQLNSHMAKFMVV